MSYSTLQVSLACESFNNHARLCIQCSDIGASYHRGEEPCPTGDALSKPIRGMFKQQDAQLQRDFPGSDQDVIIDAAMQGPAYNLLAFLNERRRQRAKRPSPVIQHAIPVPTQVRPAYYSHNPANSMQVEVGGRSARYHHSRSDSDTSVSQPSSSPQTGGFYHPASYPPRGAQYLAPPTSSYYTEHETGRRAAEKRVRFERG